MTAPLFELRDFAPPKPAHADGCFYCRPDDDGIYPDRERHDRDHLPITCTICGDTEPNRFRLENNHSRMLGDWRPVTCTSLCLRLNHLTYDLLHRETPAARDWTAIDLGWRIAPDGEQLPPADWAERTRGAA